MPNDDERQQLIAAEGTLSQRVFSLTIEMRYLREDFKTFQQTLKDLQEGNLVLERFRSQIFGAVSVLMIVIGGVAALSGWLLLQVQQAKEINAVQAQQHDQTAIRLQDMSRVQYDMEREIRELQQSRNR